MQTVLEGVNWGETQRETRHQSLRSSWGQLWASSLLLWVPEPMLPPWGSASSAESSSDSWDVWEGRTFPTRLVTQDQLSPGHQASLGLSVRPVALFLVHSFQYGLRVLPLSEAHSWKTSSLEPLFAVWLVRFGAHTLLVLRTYSLHSGIVSGEAWRDHKGWGCHI